MSLTEISTAIGAVTAFTLAFTGFIVAVAKGVHWFIQRESARIRLELQQEQSEKTVKELTEDRDEWKSRFNDLWAQVEDLLA